MLRQNEILTKSQLVSLQEFSVLIISDDPKFSRLKTWILYGRAEKEALIPKGRYQILNIIRDRIQGPRGNCIEVMLID